MTTNKEDELKKAIVKSKKEWDEDGTNIRYKNYPELKAELKGIQEGKLQAQQEIIEKIGKWFDKLDESQNRWNLKLNNQEQLAYFDGYKDTIVELKSQIEKELGLKR